MPERVARDFPLFPLGIVALPTESVPLHIFAQRYRAMVDACLEAAREGREGEFGIVWLAREELKRIGCACAIERVLERMADGRMNILARGTRPFRLLERQDELPYPAGIVEFLEDDPEERADLDARRAARELYRKLVLAATDRPLDPEELETLDAYSMAGTVEFEAEAKQRLLELRSESARLRLLAELLSAALERMELLERLQARARSNGKIRLG
jgi:Lon protease-like protein